MQRKTTYNENLNSVDTTMKIHSKIDREELRLEKQLLKKLPAKLRTQYLHSRGNSQ